MEWRDLPKQQSLPCIGYFCNLGGFLHSACAKGLNDIRCNVSTDSPTVSTTFYAAPRPSSDSPTGRASFPRGKLLYRAFGRYHSTTRVIFATPPERHTGRSLRFRWWVVPFQPHELYSLRDMAMNHRRYSASSIVVPFGWNGSMLGTWRAADCRPYDFADGCIFVQKRTRPSLR